MRKLLVLLGVIVATIGAVASPSAAAQPSCGAVITRSTTLTADLLCPGDGLVIGASRLTIDLGGHTLRGTLWSGGTGIRVDGREDVKIINGSIEDFDTSVAVADSRRVTLRDLAIVSRSAGIRFDRVEHSYIRTSSVIGHIHPIVMVGSDTNQVTDTDAEGGPDSHETIRLVDSHGNVIRGGSFRLGGGPNVLLIDSDGNRVEDTDSSGSNVVGIELLRSDNNRIRRNITDSESESVTVVASADNEINDNDGDDSVVIVRDSTDTRMTGNTAGGLSVRSSHGTVLTSNLLTEGSFSPADGLSVDALSTGTSLVANKSFGFADDGIDVDAAGTYIWRNRADDNGDLGIEAVAGVVDGGLNRARGNGDPLQCTGVVCT